MATQIYAILAQIFVVFSEKLNFKKFAFSVLSNWKKS